MPDGEVITLKPTGGDELALTGLYSVGLELDWGGHAIEPTLAEGVDVLGAVVGTRQQVKSEASIPVRIQAETTSSYLVAANDLAQAAAALGQNGGTVSRQVEFKDGSFSEELEAEVYSCDLEPEDGWLQPYRLTSVITLHLMRSPAWLGEEAEVGSDATFTDSVKRLALEERRGNIPGPARVVLADNEETMTYQDVVLGDTPSLYWALDGDTGATDLSGNARDGTGAGGVTIGGFASSPLAGGGTSTNLDGSNDTVANGSYTPWTGARTIEAWVYRDNTTDTHQIWGTDATSDVPYLRAEGGGSTVRLGVAASATYVWGSALPANAWTHLVLTFDEPSNTAELFKDGVSLGSQSVSEAWGSGTGFRLTIRQGDSALALDGKMAHVAVYESALSGATILEHYTAATDASVLTGPQARRFVELGGAFTQEPDQVEYLAADFTLDAASSADDTSGGAIGANCLFLTSVLPAPQTLGTLEDLPLVGSYRCRLRFRGGDDDAEYFVRVVWRTGTGPWKELDWVSAPDSTNYYDVDAGTILNLGSYAAETITVRVDVKSSAASTADFRLNGLTLTPSELYAVVRGLPVDVPNEGLVAFDDFADMDAGDVLDDGATPRVAPSGGTWDEAGDSSPELTSTGFGNLTRPSAGDSTSNIGTGQYVILGSTDYTNTENTVAGYVSHKGSTLTESWLGALVRYTDSNNWLIAALRVRRKNDGTYVTYVSLYKRVSGTITQIAQKRAKNILSHYHDGNNYGTLTASIGVSVTAAGDYEVKVSNEGVSAQTDTTVLSGTDSALATSGALEDGKIGAYALTQSSSSTAYVGLNEILAFSTIATSENTDVVRASGLGVLDFDRAYTAESDGTDPQPITAYQGSRIWLPPGEGGEITAKVRSSDSEAQPDEGVGLDTAITVYHRPAWANLSDALGEGDPDEMVIL